MRGAIARWWGRELAYYHPLRLLLMMTVPYTLTALFLYEDFMPLSAPILGGMVMVGALFFYFAIVKDKRALGIYTALALVGIGLAICRVNQFVASYEKDYPFYAGKGVTVCGVVDSVPKRMETSDGIYEKYEIALQGVHSDKEGASSHFIPVEGNLRVYTPYKEERGALVVGTKVVLSGAIKRIVPTFEAGALPTLSTYYSSHLMGTMYNPTVKEIMPKNTWSLGAFLQSWRSSLAETIYSYMPGQKGVLLESLLFGADYSRLSDSICEDFATTGLIHILSVSGSHITVIMGAVYALLLKLGMRRNIALYGSMIVVILYGAMAGDEAPVIRACSTGIICAWGIILGRQYSALQGLTLVLFANLLYNPWAFMQVSFQFSYGASYGILLLYRPLYLRMRWLMEPIRSLCIITLAAQAFVLPLQIEYFQMISLSTFIANAVAGPLLELVITIGLGVVTLCTIIAHVLPGIHPLTALIERFLFHLVELLLLGGVSMVTTIAKLPYAMFTVRAWSLIECLLYYIIVLLSYLFVGRYISMGKFALGGAAVSLLLLVHIYMASPLTVHVLQYSGVQMIGIRMVGAPSLVYIRGDAGLLALPRTEDRILHFLQYYGLSEGQYILTMSTSWRTNDDRADRKAFREFLESHDFTPLSKKGAQWKNGKYKSMVTAYNEGNGFYSIIAEHGGKIFSLVNGQNGEKSIKLRVDTLEGCASFQTRIPSEFDRKNPPPVPLWCWQAKGRFGDPLDSEDDRLQIVGVEPIKSVAL